MARSVATENGSVETTTKRGKEKPPTLPTPPPPTKAVWVFDKARADAAFDEAMKASVEYADTEISRIVKRRALMHKVYDFCDAIMPLDELDALKRTTAEWASYDAPRIGLPKEVQQYLRSKKLPLAHGNATNWFLAIYQGFEQAPRLTLPKAQRNMLEEDADDIREGLSLVSKDQAQLLRDARYKEVSRSGMVVTAALEKRDPSLIDINPKSALAIYEDHRKAHPHLVPLLRRKKKEEEGSDKKDDRTEEEKAADAAAYQERLRKEREALGWSPNQGDGAETLDTTAIIAEYGSERLPGTSDGTETEPVTVAASDTVAPPTTTLDDEAVAASETVGADTVVAAPRESGVTPPVAPEPATVTARSDAATTYEKEVVPPSGSGVGDAPVEQINRLADQFGRLVIVKPGIEWVIYPEPQTSISFGTLPASGMLVFDRNDAGEVVWLGYGYRKEEAVAS
jgi:hypothetical protein